MTCMRENEYHLHPIDMSDELRYDYHRAILARPDRDRMHDRGQWIRGLLEAIFDWARAEGKAIRRKVDLRNPQGGIEMRCMTGVQRNLVGTAA